MEFVVPSTIGNNPLYITINDTKYTLGPGTTVDVPQAVITEVQRMLAAQNKEAPAVEPPFAGGGSSGGGATIVRSEGAVLDKTAGEIFAAAQTGAVIVLTIFDNAVVTSELMTSAGKGKGTIHIFKVGSDNYVASSADDYPTISEE